MSGAGVLIHGIGADVVVIGKTRSSVGMLAAVKESEYGAPTIPKYQFRRTPYPPIKAND
jgi:hypothetical protein